MGRTFLSQSINLMDDNKPTTRKSFMQKAGLAFAGLLSLPAAATAASRDTKHAPAKELKAGPFKRIRPAKGTVQRIA